jgi:Sulfotransferase domain
MITYGVPQYFSFLHAKCGSACVAQTMEHIAYYLGLTFGQCENQQDFAQNCETCEVVALRNATPRSVILMPPTAKGIHVIRDPRDAILSRYFHYRNPANDVGGTAEIRKELEYMSFDDGLLLEIDRRGFFMTSLDQWDYTRPSILETKLEDMLADRLGFFRKAFAFLEIRIDDGDISAFLSIFDERMKSYSRGQIESTLGYTEQSPGQWKKLFTPKHIAAFEKWCPLIERLGYEKCQ